MLTGEIRNQIDRIWDAFWSGGISNPLEVIEPSVDTSNPAIDRRFKTGHFRRPTETHAVLLRELLSAQVGVDFGAPAAWPTFEHMCVMEEAIEERGDRGGVAEQFAPVVDGPVRCQ